jgi:fatty acid desaturase
MEHEEHTQAERGGRSPAFKWIAIGLLVAAAALFIADHWVHVPQFLPYLLIALCPLMHLFGHGKHGHHGGHRSGKSDNEQP